MDNVKLYLPCLSRRYLAFLYTLRSGGKITFFLPDDFMPVKLLENETLGCKYHSSHAKVANNL